MPNVSITAIIISYKRGFYGKKRSNGPMKTNKKYSGDCTRLQRGEW